MNPPVRSHSAGGFRRRTVCTDARAARRRTGDDREPGPLAERPQGQRKHGNPVVHFEVGGRNIDRTRAFYFELFGWAIRMDPTGYGVVDTGSEVGIGAASCRRLPRCLRT